MSGRRLQFALHVLGSERREKVFFSIAMGLRFTVIVVFRHVSHARLTDGTLFLRNEANHKARDLQAYCIKWRSKSQPKTSPSNFID